MRFLTKVRHAVTAARTTSCATKFKEMSICGGCLMVAVGLGLAGRLTAQSAEPPAPNVTAPAPPPRGDSLPNVVNVPTRVPDRLKKIEAANIERKRQIADDSAMLLRLATELKTAVDKASKDTLSIGIIRKADEIERLAHGVKEKMKLTMNAN